MTRQFRIRLLSLVVGCVFISGILFSLSGCGGGGDATPLQVEEVDPNDPDITQDIPGSSTGDLHAIFSGQLGIPISKASMIQVDPDPTGYNALNDFDGDGIANDREITTSPFVADYPRIVTRISTPITMEIRKDETNIIDNHTETIEDNDVKDTITNSMEDKQYSSLNNKTTPYVTKESYSNSGSHSDAYGYTASGKIASNVRFAGFGGGGEVSFSKSYNQSVSDSFARSEMSEKTVFDDVNYVDNLDRNGIEFKNETVNNITKHYRQSEVSKSTYQVGSNAGLVRASLFIKNMTVNMPVKITDVICTLTFRTPAGEYLPIKTFRLRNEDWSEFEEEIYGNEELGPYTIEVANLNTNEVKKALANGYVPQIHVVSFKMSKVSDSNYNPGVDNLKIVEETAKGRTATIKIVGTNFRELYRVCAFDSDSNGNIIPGISLKKAIFNILRDQIGSGESWEADSDGNALTVTDTHLKWKAGAVDKNNYIFNENVGKNKWRKFETYVKTWTDEYNKVHRIETVKRINSLSAYNPFSIEDNPHYNSNELLTRDEVLKMKYWVILHNGRYFEGDLNDPIWAGERYEIICVDMQDFNNHFSESNFYYTLLQSMEPFYLDTRWNALLNKKEFDRSVYIGKVVKGDVVHLEIDLQEARYLFDPSLETQPIGNPHALVDYDGLAWYDYNYTFQPSSLYADGIPGEFSHIAYGGINNFTVSINQSQFAREYKISFRNAGNPLDPWREVKVSREELEALGGNFIINRTTLDINGNTIGDISGSTATTEVFYWVNVTALGQAYGVNVSKNSISNGQVKPKIFDAESNIPGAFTYNVSGYKNSMELRIADCENAEFFLIRYKGPLNSGYGLGQSAPTVMRVAHAGSNEIKISNPFSEVSEPGVYIVQVFAVNKNCMNGDVIDENLIREASNGAMFTTVEYERFVNQKVYSPNKSASLFDFKALDLEVNFNDGSGWYNLFLSSGSRGDKNIDCRYTSYIEYDKQKFHVFFKAPVGDNDEYSGIFDVFMGGREEVDVYIRTVAKPEYRDRYWVKPQTGAFNQTDSNYVFLHQGEANFLNYWLNTDWSDASKLEAAIQEKNYSDLSSVPQGDFALVHNSMADYFFSPLEHKKMRIKATITDTLGSPGNIQQLDEPEYSASAGDGKISITNMESTYADAFEVYWKPGNSVALYEPINAYPWYKSSMVTIGSDNTFKYTIDNLTPNADYIVAVKAYNQYGTSSPKFYGDNIATGNIIEAAPIIPYTLNPPLKPEGVSVNISPPGNKILVSNINVPGEIKYEVHWKSELDTEWLNYATVSKPYPDFNPLSYIIDNLWWWEQYVVKVRAVTAVNVPGPFSDEMLIETYQPQGGWDGISISSLGWGSYRWTHTSNEDNKYGTLNMDISGLPGSISEYKIVALANYTTRIAGAYRYYTNVTINGEWLDRTNTVYPIYNDVCIFNGTENDGTYTYRYYFMNLSASFEIRGKDSYGRECFVTTIPSIVIGSPTY